MTYDEDFLVTDLDDNGDDELDADTEKEPAPDADEDKPDEDLDEGGDENL